MKALDAAITVLRSDAHDSRTAPIAREKLFRMANALNDVRIILLNAAKEPRLDVNDRPHMPRLLGAQEGRRGLLSQINTAIDDQGDF